MDQLSIKICGNCTHPCFNVAWKFYFRVWYMQFRPQNTVSEKRCFEREGSGNLERKCDCAPVEDSDAQRLPAPLWALVIAGHQAVLAWTVWKGGFSCSRSQLLKRQLHVFNRAIWDERLYILFTSASHWDLLLSLSWRAQDPICKQDLGWPAEVVKSSPSVIFRADVSKLYPQDQLQHASYFYE